MHSILINNWDVFRDIFIAIFMGIMLGFLIDVIFPMPKKLDSGLKTASLIILQVIIDGFVVYYYGLLFMWIFGVDADHHRGFTIFGVLFFLVQCQLLVRLNYLFRLITGRDFED